MMDRLENIAKGLAWALVACLVLTLLFGCRSKEVVVPMVSREYIVKTDTLRLVSRDSVRVLDSVFVSQVVRGDTVFVTRERWRVSDHGWVDTLLRVRVDTVVRTDTVTVVRTVEADLTSAQKRLLGVGRLALAAVGAGVVGAGFWLWLRRK